MTAGKLRRVLVVAILALFVQYLLGIAVNLFVTIPTKHPGAQPSEYFSGVVDSYNEDFSSMIMASLFAVACYVLALNALSGDSPPLVEGV